MYLIVNVWCVKVIEYRYCKTFFNCIFHITCIGTLRVQTFADNKFCEFRKF